MPPDRLVNHHNYRWPTHHGKRLDTSIQFLGPIKSKVLHKRGARTTQDLIKDYPRTEHPFTLPDFTISVRKHLSSGRINAGFTASAGSIPLVTKFAYPTEQDATYPEAGNEAHIYHHNLKALQGTLVPKWYGMWVALQPSAGRPQSKVEVLCTVLEDAGEPLDNDDVHSLSVKEKNIIVSKYHQLHAAGVIHNSAYPKHWVRHGRLPIDTVRLIDFGLSLRVDSDTATTAGFKHLADVEIDNVCQTLNLHVDDLEYTVPKPPAQANGNAPRTRSAATQPTKVYNIPKHLGEISDSDLDSESDSSGYGY